MHSFSELGGYQQTALELSGAGDPERVSAARMSSGVFPALSVQPLLGRFFTQEEDRERRPVMLLSYETWHSRFQGDPDVLDKKLLLDRKPYEVIGVMPKGFEFPIVPGHLNRAALWVPMSFDGQTLSVSGSSDWSYEMLGRLKPGVTVAQATVDAARVAAETVRNYPASMAEFKMHPVVRPLQEETAEQARPLIRMLFLAVVVVLLIVCANLAGLLLVRAIQRRRDVAVRLALGARTAAVIWQAVLESLLLSAAGGVLGIMFSALGVTRGPKLPSGGNTTHQRDRIELVRSWLRTWTGIDHRSPLWIGSSIRIYSDQRQ